MKLKTNILYIFHVSSIGGGSFCLLNMVKKLDKDLFNPIVLLKESGPLCDELQKLGARVYFEKTLSIVPYNSSIFTLNSLKLIYSIFLSIPRVRYWIEKTNADIVHINTMMMYPYLLATHKTRKKAIVHVREHWPENEHKCQLKLARRTIRKFADKIIAINKTSANMIDCPSKTEVVYDWIDFENRDAEIDFKPLFGNNLKGLNVFLFLGGTIWLKGALEVVEVFKSIENKDIRLLLVGCENKELDFNGVRGFLKKMLGFFNIHTYAHKVKLLAKKDSRIVFIPATYHVKSLIEQSFCVVSFFTIPHANLPIAEAGCLGKPTISADTPEAREYAGNSDAALFFEMNNKADFRKKIEFSLLNHDFLMREAENTTLGILELFDSTRNSVLLNKIYRDLLI